MLKYRIKDYLTLIICVIAMIIMLVFSTQMGGSDPQKPVDNPAQNVQDPEFLEINYVVQNNITTGVERVYSIDQIAGNSFNTKVVVSGLADTAVENKINRSILDKYNEMYKKPVPQYRGITSSVDFGTEKQYKSVSMEVMGNYNNILSILVTANLRQSDIVFSDCETLNYDLRTGELINIKQMFPDGQIEYLNEYLGNRVVYFGNEYPGGNAYNPAKNYYMLSAFRGVDENQKFYFDEYGITILIDYENEEFYMTGYRPFFISIPYSDIGGHISFDGFINCAAAEGCDGNASLGYYFEDVDENTGDEEEAEEPEAPAPIYSSDVRKYMLISTAKGTEFEKINVPDSTSNLTFSASCSYPEDTPEAIVKKAEKLAAIEGEISKSMQNQAKKKADGVYSCMSSVSVNKIGNYYNVVSTVDCLLDEKVNTKIEGYVFDDNGNEIQLKDVFLEGSNYSEVIKACVLNQLSDDFSKDNYGGKTLDEICAGVTFVLENTGMQIKTQPLQFSGYESSVSVFIPYEKFGCDYMTIFN